MHKPSELGSNSQHLNSWFRQVGRERIGERARRDCNRGITSSRILIAAERRQAVASCDNFPLVGHSSFLSFARRASASSTVFLPLTRTTHDLGRPFHSRQLNVTHARVRQVLFVTLRCAFPLLRTVSPHFPIASPRVAFLPRPRTNGDLANVIVGRSSHALALSWRSQTRLTARSIGVSARVRRAR